MYVHEEKEALEREESSGEKMSPEVVEGAAARAAKLDSEEAEEQEKQECCGEDASPQSERPTAPTSEEPVASRTTLSPKQKNDAEDSGRLISDNGATPRNPNQVVGKKRARDDESQEGGNTKRLREDGYVQGGPRELSEEQERCHHTQRNLDVKVHPVKLFGNEGYDQWCDWQRSHKCTGSSKAQTVLNCTHCRLRFCVHCWKDYTPFHSNRRGGHGENERRRFTGPTDEARERRTQHEEGRQAYRLRLK